MSGPSQGSLFFWNDPDELLNTLYEVSREPVSELRDAIGQLLDHDDPDIREEALRILVTRWKDQSFRPRAIRLLKSDPAATVRSAAAFAIAASATDASRAEDSLLLTRTLQDERQALAVRAAAYDALIILHRKGAGEDGWPFTSCSSEFNPAKDVDWNWIQSL